LVGNYAKYYSPKRRSIDLRAQCPKLKKSRTGKLHKKCPKNRMAVGTLPQPKSGV